MHRVVDESGVSSDGGAAPCGLEVRLGRDRVLLVAEVVADVGEVLDQRDAEIRGAAIAPGRDEERQPVEEESPEGWVVLGEVIDLRFVDRRAQADVDVLAVEVRGTVDLVAEWDPREDRIEARWDTLVIGGADECQPVTRVVSRPGAPKGCGTPADPEDIDADAGDALATSDADLVGDEGTLLVVRQWIDEVHRQAPLPEEACPLTLGQAVVLGTLVVRQVLRMEIAYLDVVDRV